MPGRTTKETDQMERALDRKEKFDKCRSDRHYRMHFICCACRKSFKGSWPHVCPGCKRDLVFHEHDLACPDCGCDLSFRTSRKCPDCGNPMIEVGKDFRVPRRSDLKAWKRIEMRLQGRGSAS